MRLINGRFIHKERDLGMDPSADRENFDQCFGIIQSSGAESSGSGV